MFNDKQKDLLAAPLSAGNVKGRKQGGRTVSYIEGWKAIEEANRIFGFDGWTRETIDIKCVSERERGIGDKQDPGWGVSYIAKARIIVFAGDSLVTREGVGAGHGIDRDLGQAHESAIKEAETDAMKRALMTFGYPFGLALYDKQQEHVVNETQVPKATPAPTPKSIGAPAPQNNLLSEPAASEVEARLKEDIDGCVTVEELDKFVRSDSYRRRVGSLPDKHRSKVRTHGQQRLETVKAKAAA